MKATKIITWCVEKLRYYVVFSKEITFISGLVISYSFAENAVVSILITHILEEEEWNGRELGLPTAAIIVNLQEGASSVLQLFFAFLSDAYFGRFKVLLSSTVVYDAGLFLCWIAVLHEKIWIFYTALVLITMAKSTEDVILHAFLDDQLFARDRPDSVEEEERAYSRSDFWWKLFCVLGFIAAVLGARYIGSFMQLSKISAIAIGASLIWFLLGTKFYMRVKPTGSPLSSVWSIMHAAIVKRNVKNPQTPEQLFHNSSGLSQILPHVPWLRWLDKAAVRVMPQDQDNPSRYLHTVDEVRRVKYLFNMVPMWLTFLMFSLVAATGSTFFLEQVTEINDGFIVLIFNKLDNFTSFIVDFVTDHFLFRRLFRRFKNVTLVRIGIGMIFSVLCCIAAWRNAVHWKKLVQTYGPDDAYMHTSVMLLTPQFVLMGVMKGLAQDGLVNFFNSMVPESFRRYGESFGEFVVGIGKFLSVVLIISFRSWFGTDINSSHLDKYYALLGLLSFLNATIYWFVSYWYWDNEGFLIHDSDYQESIEMGEGYNAFEAHQDGLGPLVLRSKSDKGNYMYHRSTTRVFNRRTRSFSGPVLVPQPLKNSFTDVDQETVSRSQVSDLAPQSSSSASADRMLNVSLSFPHLSTKGIHWRTHSMHSRDATKETVMN